MSFLFVSLAVIGTVYGYVGWRIIIPAGLSALWTAVLWGLVALCVVMPFAALFMRLQGFNPFWKTFFVWIAYLSMGFISLLFSMLVVRDVLFLVLEGGLRLFAIGRSAFGAGAFTLHASGPSLRFLAGHQANLVILGACFLLTLYGIYGACKTPRVKEVAIPVRNAPQGLLDLRIVQITDIHASSTVKHGFIESVVNRVNELKPDVIVFTGDIADGAVAEMKNDIAPLAGLNAPYGVFFVTGNHEYYSGVSDWLEEVRRLGMIPLVNEHRIIEHGSARIMIAGVGDFDAGHFDPAHAPDPEKALSGDSVSDYRILLAHQPRSVFAAERAGFDLQLSGHTHGGQYLPWNNFVRLQQPYVHGLHRYGGIWLYVSRGTGYWGPPLRIGVPSEITLFRFEEDSQ